jgi:hypothetical protein
MNQERKKRIEWFLKFLDVNFEIEPPGKTLELLRDMHIAFGRTLHLDLAGLQVWAANLSNQETSTARQAMRRLQSMLVDFWKSLMTKRNEIERGWGQERFISSTSELPDILLVGQINDANVKAKIVIAGDLKIERIDKQEAKWKIQWPSYKDKIPTFRILLTPKADDPGFLFSLAQELDGIPLSYFKKCEQCGKWLLQSGKKHRRFCSDICRATWAFKAKSVEKAQKKEPRVRYIHSLKNKQRRENHGPIS